MALQAFCALRIVGVSNADHEPGRLRGGANHVAPRSIGRLMFICVCTTQVTFNGGGFRHEFRGSSGFRHPKFVDRIRVEAMPTASQIAAAEGVTDTVIYVRERLGTRFAVGMFAGNTCHVVLPFRCGPSHTKPFFTT